MPPALRYTNLFGIRQFSAVPVRSLFFPQIYIKHRMKTIYPLISMIFKKTSTGFACYFVKETRCLLFIICVSNRLSVFTIQRSAQFIVCFFCTPVPFLLPIFEYAVYSSKSGVGSTGTSSFVSLKYTLEPSCV